MSNWTKYGMPEDMTGKSFLDVGCWEGLDCREAVRRGADPDYVVGVDLVADPKLRELVERHKFHFLQLDIFTEQFVALPVFDVVLCSGVFYHVPNPVSLLLRLRSVTEELLVFETAMSKIVVPHPIMEYCPANSFRSNHSAWWLPNEACLIALLQECGFGNIKIIWRRDINDVYRICLHAEPLGNMAYDKMFPRQISRMGIGGGSRPRI